MSLVPINGYYYSCLPRGSTAFYNIYKHLQSKIGNCLCKNELWKYIYIYVCYVYICILYVYVFEIDFLFMFLSLLCRFLWVLTVRKEPFWCTFASLFLSQFHLDCQACLDLWFTSGFWFGICICATVGEIFIIYCALFRTLHWHL